MLSDTLFDGVQEIQDYRKRYPDIYNPLKTRLDALVTEMDAIRKLLDFPPDLFPLKSVGGIAAAGLERIPEPARCPDCGEPGYIRGHMGCQYPS